MDLLSLVLTLRPLSQPDPTQVLPEWWGRAAHKLLLDVVESYDPPLAHSLHEPDANAAGGNTIRPFTVSTLLGRFPHGALDTQATYHLRFTALNQEIAAMLQQAAQDGRLAAGREIELDYHPFQVQAATADAANAGEAPSSWAAATTYSELSAALLLSKTPTPRRVTLHFASPTTFKNGGRHVPVPLPELVFGSLLERWNTFAPITFPPEARRFAAECLALSRYKLSTRAAAFKGNSLRVGAVGEASYTATNYDRYWMSVIGVLAAFALFAGVGAGTSMGLGQCREAGEPGRSPDEKNEAS